MLIYVGLLVSSIGHASWDNILQWMIANDPDASVLHMHWIRTLFMWVILLAISRHTQLPPQQWTWWFEFSFVGWTVPGIAYTTSVMMTGHRISLSLQPFIPLLVCIGLGRKLTVAHLFSLTTSLIGSLVIWLDNPWSHRDVELWMVWLSLLTATVHALALVRWFIMLDELKTNRIAAMARGVGLSVVTFFTLMIMWTPQHLMSTAMNRWDMWFLVIVASALSVGCKYWVIARCSAYMTTDAVATFECIHPIATFCSDLLRGQDMFERMDIVTIILLIIGWICYPKMNI